LVWIYLSKSLAGFISTGKAGTQAIGALGGTAQLAAGVIDRIDPDEQENKVAAGLRKFGQRTSLYAKNNRAILESLEPTEVLFKGGKFDKEVGKNPQFWVDTFLQGVTQMSTAVAAGGGSAAGGAVIGSLMEAAPFYEQLLADGDERAEEKAMAFGLAVAALEKIGLDKIFKGGGRAASGKALTTAIAAFTEGGTELLENPIQTIIELMGREGITPQERNQAILDSIKDGYNDFAAGALTGGPVSIASQLGGQPTAQEPAAEAQVPEQANFDVRVEMGDKVADATTGSQAQRAVSKRNRALQSTVEAVRQQQREVDLDLEAAGIPDQQTFEQWQQDAQARFPQEGEAVYEAMKNGTWRSTSGPDTMLAKMVQDTLMADDIANGRQSRGYEGAG